MKIAVTYLRYSSDRQTEQSIEGQLRDCMEYAERNGITIVHNYIDRAMTGTNDNREDFQRMMKDSDKRAWDYVLVYKLGRFSRNKYEMAIHRKHLQNNGIKIISVKENIPETPEGILLESLIEGMNQYYSEELSQKTKRGLRETRIKGYYSGGRINYGYDLSDVMAEVNGKQLCIAKKITVNESEAAVIREIFTEYAGGKNVAQIIRALTSKGIMMNGKPFPDSTIYNILRNEKYTGVYHVGGGTYNNIFPPILSCEIFNIVRKRIDSNKYGKHPPDVSYLLRNVIRCGYCGRRVISFTGTSKSQVVWRYYKCYNSVKGKEGCHGKSIKKEDIENLVVETLANLIGTESNLNFLADAIVAQSEKAAQENNEVRHLEGELAKVNKALKNLLVAIEAGIYTDTTRERMLQLEEEKRVLYEKLVEQKVQAKNVLKKADVLKYIRPALNQTKQILVDILVREIRLYDDKIVIMLKYADEAKPNGQRKGPERNLSEWGTVLKRFPFISECRSRGRNGKMRSKVYEVIICI